MSEFIRPAASEQAHPLSGNHELLILELASMLRRDIDQLRNYGITLQDVWDGVSLELGRTSGALADTFVLDSMFARFRFSTMRAHRNEREIMERQASPAVRSARRRRR